MEGLQDWAVNQNLLVAVAHMDCDYTDLGHYRNLHLHSSHLLDYDAFEVENRAFRGYHRVCPEH